MLFAFLLGVPFTQRFASVSDLQRDAYFITFLCTAAATALLIAPSAQHRILWRANEKEHLLRMANSLALAGMLFLALAIAGAVFLVTDILFEVTIAALVAGATAAFFGWFWYALPLLRRLRG